MARKNNKMIDPPEGWRYSVHEQTTVNIMCQLTKALTENEKLRADNDRLTRDLNKERAAMMEEAAKIAATWDEGGCECNGYGCGCGNSDDAASAAASATARSISSKFRVLAEVFRAAGNSPEGNM